MSGRLPLLVALASALACSGSPQLVLTVLTPQAIQGNAGAIDQASFTVRASWPAGDAGVSAVGFAQGFNLAVPSGVPIDLWITASSSNGSLWRGERHGLVLSGSGPTDAGVLLTPVGLISSFQTLQGLPALAGASATPLDLGRVLIAGGALPDGGLSQQAWIYDQATLTFSPAAPLELPRAHHLALSLGGTLVLLAGGDGAGEALELYLPTDGGTLVGQLSHAQRRPSGALLAGGGAVVGCGLALDGGPLSAAAGDGVDVWTPGQSPARTALSCAGGQVVAVPGGVWAVPPSGAVATLEGSAALVDGLARPRDRFAAAYDGDGGVLVVGGGQLDAGDVPCDAVEDLGLPQPAAPLHGNRADEVLVPVSAGFLAIGGVNEAGAARADVELLGRPPLSPGQLLPLSAPRALPAATAIPGYGLVLIVSGQGTNGSPAPGLDLYTAP